jgi:hypothetical protein
VLRSTLVCSPVIEDVNEEMAFKWCYVGLFIEIMLVYLWRSYLIEIMLVYLWRSYLIKFTRPSLGECALLAAFVHPWVSVRY